MLPTERGLKRHPIISSQFCRSKVRVDLSGFSVQGLTGQNQCGGQPGLLDGGSGEAYAPSLIEIIGRVQVLAVVGLRSPSLPWLLATRCSQLLETTLLSFYMAPFIFKARNSTSNPSCPSNVSDFPFYYKLEKTLKKKSSLIKLGPPRKSLWSTD